MSLPQPLLVSNTVGGLGAIVDAGPTQNGPRTFSLTSPASPPNTGDTVQILGSNDGFVNDYFVIGNVATTDSVTPGSNPALTSALTARYLRTYRVAIGNPASPNVNCEAAESSPSAGGGGGGGSQGPLTSMNPFVQADLAAGGNIGTSAPLTVDNFTSVDVAQNTASQALTFFAPTSTTVDKMEFVSADGTASFTMYGQTISAGTFGLVKYNSVSTSYTRPCYASLQGDTGLGFNMALGPLDARSITINSNGHTGLQLLTTGATALGNSAGGTTITSSGAGGISADTAAAGPITIGAANATSFALGPGVLTTITLRTTAGTIGIGDNASAQTINAGNTQTASQTNIKAGNSGIQLGAALLLTAPVAIADGTGTLGSAATTVDLTSRLVVTQSTAVVTQANMRTLAAPSVATAGRRCIVESSTASTASFTVGDATLKQGVNLGPGQACEFEWNGAAWIPLACTAQDPIQGAALTDAAGASARAGQITQYTLPATTLSTNRTNTLSTTGAIKGDVQIVTRLDVTANTYTVAGAQNFVMPASKINFCTFRFDGAAWQFVSGGSQ